MKKRNFPTILYINFLLVSPCTSCIYIAIPVCHKQSPCNPFYQAIYALPKSTLHSIRQAIGLHYTNIPILPAQRRLSINASNCKTAMCVFFLKRTLIRACQFCKINSLQSLQLICQQITIKVIPAKSSKAFWIRQKDTEFYTRGAVLEITVSKWILLLMWRGLYFCHQATQHLVSCCYISEFNFVFILFVQFMSLFLC